MRVVTICIGYVLFVAPAHADTSQSRDGELDALWNELIPSEPGASAADLAAHAKATVSDVDVAKAQARAQVAGTWRTLSRYAPNLAVTASARRTNLYEFALGGPGASVAAANPGALSVGTCPDGISNNCVVDSQGVPLDAVASAPFATPRNTYAVDAVLSVPFSDYVLSLVPARRGAVADRKAAKLRRDGQIEQVAVNARIAYYDWVKARTQRYVTERSLVSAKARLHDAQVAVRAGAMAVGEVHAFESLVASSEGAVQQATSFERLAAKRVQLATRWDKPLVLGEDLRKPLATAKQIGDLSTIVQQGLQSRVEIQALRQATKAAGHASNGLLAAQWPRLDGVGNVTHANPNQGFFPPEPVWRTSWYLGLSLSWNVRTFLDSHLQKREVDANHSALLAQQKALEQAVELEITAAFEEWQRAVEATDIGRRELAAADASQKHRVALFQGGEATATEVVDAEVNRHNALLKAVHALIDQRIALAKLSRAAGIPYFDEPAR